MVKQNVTWHFDLIKYELFLSIWKISPSNTRENLQIKLKVKVAGGICLRHLHTNFKIHENNILCIYIYQWLQFVKRNGKMLSGKCTKQKLCFQKKLHCANEPVSKQFLLQDILLRWTKSQLLHFFLVSGNMENSLSWI